MMPFLRFLCSMRSFLPLSLLGVTLFLASCESAPKSVACPQVRLLPGAETMVRFNGEGLDITDVLMEADFTATTGQCEVDEDQVAVTLLIRISAQRGPASDETVGEFSYFIAVVDEQKKVLQRRTLEAAVDFSGNRTRAPYLERLLINIPKPLEKSARDYTILMGLELSREELDFNRRQRAS